jgi:pentapeptide MXKDX repeat protein
MNLYAAVIGLIVLVLGGGYFAMQSSGEMEQKDVMAKEEMVKDEMMKKDEAMVKDGAMTDDAMKKDGAMEADAMKGDDAMMKDGSMKKEDTMMKDESAMMKKDDAMVKGTIETYSPEKLAFANGGKVLLFFHANWCPICRQLDAEASANPNLVPDGIHVLKVDYDTATDLKKKYGITVQHTFVQVDAAGNLLQKFSDASNYSTVFSRVK